MKKFGTILMTGAITLMFASSAIAWGGDSSGSHDSGKNGGNESRSSISQSRDSSDHQRSNRTNDGGSWGADKDDRDSSVKNHSRDDAAARWHDSDKTKDFNDMNKKSWAEPFVEHMQARNVVGGYPDGTFQPNKPVTRAEATKMIMYESGATNGESDIPFNDAAHIPDWSKSVLQAALDNFVILTSVISQKV